MNDIFNDFKSNFEKRFSSYSILNLGEDSVRYDFFVALMNGLNIAPHEIQVEYPINKMAFISNRHPNSKRNENPQVDLYSSTPKLSITAEFGLFKQNSNPEASINKTEKLFKMINDMLRLSLNKIYTPSDSYFVCVADRKILGAQTHQRLFPPFPSPSYKFNYSDLNSWITNIKSANQELDDRFTAKANQIQLSVHAELVYNQKIPNPPNIYTNQLETRVLIYKVDCENAKGILPI